MFYKIYTLFFFFFFVLMNLSWSMSKFYQVSFNYICLALYTSSFYKFSFISDLIMLKFFLAVIPVTLFVVSYSKIYMSNYNNKKFMTLTMMFFTSMIIMISSSSFLNLMVGWDGLGLTSICLILFYPNKTSLTNSIMTMFFNRLGDIMMMISLSIILSNYTEFFYCAINKLSISLILIICAFSKSAQFPLSSWLPAAMSAPTPISAMVHSSTLVTAGIFLASKMEIFLMESYIYFIPLVISSLTFLLGGFLAKTENDMKKVVAFSTMSQISMTMMFCFIFSVWMSLIHMFFHAFFKTMLFSCCGVLFIMMFSDQNKKMIQTKTMSIFNMFNLSMSIIMMTGVIFSSSFFSKDLVLEMSLTKSESCFFIIMMTGTLMTIIYCSYIFTNLKKFVSLKNSFEEKKMNMKNMIFMIFLTSMISMLTKEFFFMESKLFISTMELNFITLLILMMMFKELKKNKSMIKSLSFSIFNMKEFSYSILGKVMKKKLLELSSLTESMIFKPNLFNKSIMNSSKLKKTNILIFMIILLLI